MSSTTKMSRSIWLPLISVLILILVLVLQISMPKNQQSDMSTRIPIVLCGASSWIGQGVIAGLKPEYEVIHFIFTPQAGAAEIPGLLKGQAPAPSSKAFTNNIGSRNYSKPPVAVVMGSAYGDDDVKLMRDACGSSNGGSVSWLKPDTSKRTPPLFWGYGKHMVGRVKACLEELEREGRMTEGGIVLY